MRVFILFILFVASRGLLAQTGITWSQTQTVAPNHFGNLHPRIAVDGAGNPLLIWGKSNNQVHFSRQTGGVFSAPVKLNPDSIPVFAASWGGPDLAAHGDSVYVVYKKTPEDLPKNGIYLVRSFDGGNTFSGPKRVDAIADSISRFAAVGTDADGQPLVGFMKFNPGFLWSRYVVAKSADFGDTFGPDILASGWSGGTVCDCCPAALTTAGNTTALLYRDNLNSLRPSWAGISFDGGNSFSNGIEVDDTKWFVNSCPASGPDGVISGDKLHSVFMSAAGGQTLCYRSRSSISGLEMEITEPLTGDFAGLGSQNYPRIADAGNAATIVWKQSVNGASQLAVQFTDSLSNGFPPGHTVLVANNVVDADVAMVDGKVHVAWAASNDGTVKFKTGTFNPPISLLPEAEKGFSVRLSPNPVAENELTVLMQNVGSQRVGYQIHSTVGVVLLNGEQVSEAGQIRVDVSSLPAGFYWISLQTGKKEARAAFVR